ncbi:MAG: toxin-antitoxin system YwqK family antitoxin [Bacteroidia bacterium]
MNRSVSLLLFFSFSISGLLAQSVPSSIKHKGEKLLVYPFRITDETEVPSPGFNIPDGRYAVLYEYRFKKKLFRKALELRDTSIVSGIVTVKDNQPEGPALFYNYIETSSGRLRSKPANFTNAFFRNGLKEGAWTCTYRSGGREVTTYKEGLQNGYYLSYSSRNVLLLKEKYMNENKVDTVFSYRSDGSLEYMYDLRTEAYTFDPDNFYSWLAHKRGFIPYDVKAEDVGSFLRTYDKKGNLQNDLRFINGNLQEFKKILDPADGTTYSLSKSDPGQADTPATFTFISSWTGKKSSSVITYIYKNFDLEKEINVHYSAKTHLSDSTFYDYYKLKPGELKSKRPVLVAQMRSQSRTRKTWYIPFYKYGYTENNYRYIRGRTAKPLFIDTLRDLIYVNDTSFYDPGIQCVKHKLVIDQEHYESFESELRPYRANRYLINNGYKTIVPEESDYSNYGTTNDNSNYFNKTYKVTTTGTTILQDGKPFTGKVFLSSGKPSYHKKTDTWVFPSGIKNYQCARGTIENGKYSGDWQIISSGLKAGPSDKDLYAYFLKHPEDNSFYSTVCYRNGSKNGVFTSYDCQRTGDFWYMRAGKTKKEKRKLIIYKDEESNYVNDTLNGTYKTWYPNGKPKEDMNFAMGKPDGKFISYDVKGFEEYVINFNKGKLEGEFAYTHSGKLNCKAQFKDNRLNGSLIYYLESGAPYIEIIAKSDTIQSKKLFFDNKVMKERISIRPGSSLVMDSKLISSDSYLESGNKLYDFIFTADYTNYYEDGKLLSKGMLENGAPKGKWEFYNTNNTAINEVFFRDTSIALPGTSDTVEIIGYINGYYHNGKPRLKGYLRDYTAGYSCSLHQDMTTFDYYISDYWTIDGKQTCSNGNGGVIVYNEGAQRVSQGMVKQYREEGLWKYYDPDQKLNEIGKYVSGSREGVWYKGDLEGINFEDNACFDQNDSLAMKELAYSKKVLRFEKKIYRDGRVEKSETFETDQNKEREYEDYTPRRRGGRRNVIVDF